MTPEKDALIRYRLEHSDELLEDSRLLMANKRWRSAVNRLYYAIVEVVAALMTKEDILIKSHSGAKAMFELHFIKSGRVEKEWGKFYANLADDRNASDYGAFTFFEEEEVIMLAAQTEQFISLIKELISTE